VRAKIALIIFRTSCFNSQISSDSCYWTWTEQSEICLARQTRARTPKIRFGYLLRRLYSRRFVIVTPIL